MVYQVVSAWIEDSEALLGLYIAIEGNKRGSFSDLPFKKRKKSLHLKARRCSSSMLEAPSCLSQAWIWELPGAV